MAQELGPEGKGRIKTLSASRSGMARKPSDVSSSLVVRANTLRAGRGRPEQVLPGRIGELKCAAVLTDLLGRAVELTDPAAPGRGQARTRSDLRGRDARTAAATRDTAR